MQYPSAKIVVFAKTPVAGQVKTRLIPALGNDGAKQLHCQMLEHTLDTVTENKIAPVELHCSPDITDDYIQSLSKRYNMTLRNQHGNDLGERMSHALSKAVDNSSHVLLIGTDCPTLSAAYILQAIEILQSDTDVVIGPAEDGGYVLIGVKSSHPEIFTHIDWGTDKVLQQTQNRIQSHGISHKELDTLWDVDTPEDLEYLKGLKQWANLASG